jgi:hypothetical protein
MYQEKYENPQPEQSVFTVTSLMISEWEWHGLLEC